MTSIAGKLPDGDGNGLNAVAGELIENPHKVHVAIVLVDCAKITTKPDTGEVVPTARIRRIEVIGEAGDQYQMRRLLQREFERRTGQAVLPWELEQATRDAFDGIEGDAPAAE